MIIVMIIIGILAVVLTESYLTISRVSLRVEQEKNLSEESLVLTQVFQAISDEATIDYDKYNGSLEISKWFTGVLYLTWDAWSGSQITTSGNCLWLDEHVNLEDESKILQDYTWCDLVLIDQSWKATSLISQWKVTISKVEFRIIPYNSDDKYFESPTWNVLNNLHQPAFRVFIHLYSPLYQPKWTNKIDQPLQLFFNLKL